MARIQKTEEEILNGGPEIQDAETGPGETLEERLQALCLDEEAELHARIYRVQKSDARRGRVYVGSMDDYADEEFVAETYGAGTYFIAYTWKENGRTKRTTTQFSISDEYGVKNAAPVQQTAPTFSGFLGSLTAEKITLGIGLLKTVREILAPPPPPVDFTKLIEALAANRGQSVSDAVMIAAMNSIKEKNEQKSISQQLADLRAIKELAADVNEQPENETEEGDTMDYLLKMGLQMLPGLLQKQNGDFRATGAAVKDNALVNSIINDNPDLAQKFFEVAAKKYGPDAARQLADGFGINLKFNEQAAQIPGPSEV